MNNTAHCLLTNRNYQFGKHEVERGSYISTYTYDGFKMIEFYHTLDLLVFHRPIIKKGIINIFERCGLEIKYDKKHQIYEVITVFEQVLGDCHIKYTMNDWDRNFVAVKNLFNKTLMFRQKELVYNLLNGKLGTGTDQQPRPQSEAGQSSS